VVQKLQRRTQTFHIAPYSGEIIIITIILRHTHQYPSDAGRTTVAGSILVKIRTGDSFLNPSDDDMPRNEE